MENELKKYIKDGITIEGNPTKGYNVFTITTQHFNIKSLDELTPDRFEKQILLFNEQEKNQYDMLKCMNNMYY